MFYGNASVQANEVISRNIYLPDPVVTNKFRLIVRKGAESAVIKMDVIGMPPDKKYNADPMLTSQLYQECKNYNY